MVVLGVCSAAFFLVAFFAIREYSYERWLPGYRQIYRIWLELEEPGEPLRVAVTPVPLGPTVAEQAPQVESYTRLLKYPRRPVLVEAGGLRFFEEENFFTTDQSFFDVFRISLVRGDTPTALTGSDSLVITDRAAFKYFGTLDCVGRTMLLNKEDLKTVTGVMSSRQGPTHLVYDFLAKHPPDPAPNWYQFKARTYVRFAQEDNRGRVTDILRRIELDKYGVDASDYHYHLQPIDEIHLNSNFLGEFPGAGSAATVRTAIWAALIFLALGATNFAVFEAVRQSTRAKETVIRVVNGASSRQVLAQAIVEGLIVASISVLIGLFVYWVGGFRLIGLPEAKFQLLASQESWWILGAIGLVIAVVVLAASIYPAYVALKVDLSGVTKGTWRKRSGRLSIRRFLVGVQLLIAFVLVFASFRLTSQAHQLSQLSVGFSTAGLMEVELPRSTQISTQNLRDLVGRDPLVTKASLVSQAPGSALRKASFIPEGNGAEHVMASVLWGDEYLPMVMELKQVAGQSFGVDSQANRESAFIINEKAASIFGWENAVGKRLTLDSDEDTLEGSVVGTVADFHFGSVVEVIDPIVIMYAPDKAQKILLRTKPNTSDPKAVLEAIWRQAIPGEPLRAIDTSAKLDNLNQSNHQLARAGKLVASSASLVAALGLVALIAVLLTAKTREISIRRLCGASQERLIATLAGKLGLLVAIVGVIAIPIGSQLVSQVNEIVESEVKVLIVGYFLVIGLFEALLVATTALFLWRRRDRSIVDGFMD